ncbi:Uridine-cytidine kinase-like 1 [Golovinomyces cichoracearum]|uniref:Uridine kinase n=1 Tax=Golovinomyces cichoracearum TaxID=62708 RepID=A0A420IT70_9PEZI|nr:Uridine-cytidine kinase-like 1 [Golovinomyces cichoracearum]
MSDCKLKESHYSPPWADVCIIGIAGSSGSGKTTLSNAIVAKMNLPWVVILPMDSFYKPLSSELSQKAFQNEYDFDSPDALDFEILLDRLHNLKAGKIAEIPRYSFSKHAREIETTSIYSPHVLILEGIFALYDPRVLALLDMKIFCEADTDTCLSRRILRDLRERGRDVEGCLKQWFSFVKPNFERFVEPQRKVADIIVPRGVENQVAILMVTQYIDQKLLEKSKIHQAKLQLLGQSSEDHQLSHKVILLKDTPQLQAINTIIQDNSTSIEDFVFYFDRITTLLVECALNNAHTTEKVVQTPTGQTFNGAETTAEISAIVVLRGGSAFEPGLKRVLPDCPVGRILIQSNVYSGEPELHYLKLPEKIQSHGTVLILDPQMSSGGAALMAVQVLIDHGLDKNRMIFVTYFAGKMGLNRLTHVFPELPVVVCKVLSDTQERWIEKKYFGC